MWLSDWTYRKSHIINPASGAGQNYQKSIIVHYGAGVDNDENVYLDSKCLTNFGDIRFTDSTGVALLDYWIEKKVDSDYAIFWVEVLDDLSIYDRKIHIYYNKAGATSIANGDNTFIFFDDFEVDLSKWFKIGSPVISTDYAYSGTKSVKFLPVVSALSKVQLPYDSIAVHSHYYDAMSPLLECTGIGIDLGESVETSMVGIINDIEQYEYKINNVIYNSGIYRTIGWHEFEIRSSNGLKQFLVDGILMPETGSYWYNPSIDIVQGGNATELAYWDSVFKRKWVNPEPAHGTWGIEETGTGITTFNAEDIVKLNNSNQLILEDIINSLSQKSINAENILVSLFGSPHIPYTSEDILFALSALRTYMVIKEFVTYEGAFPIIGGKHLIDIEGED